MKLSLVITDGLRQVTLSPESEEEKQILEILHRQEWKLEIKRGQFFMCRGDYARFGVWPSAAGKYGNDDSTMLVLRPASEEPKPEGGAMIKGWRLFLLIVPVGAIMIGQQFVIHEEHSRADHYLGLWKRAMLVAEDFKSVANKWKQTSNQFERVAIEFRDLNAKNRDNFQVCNSMLPISQRLDP